MKGKSRIEEFAAGNITAGQYLLGPEDTNVQPAQDLEHAELEVEGQAGQPAEPQFDDASTE